MGKQVLQKPLGLEEKEGKKQHREKIFNMKIEISQEIKIPIWVKSVYNFIAFH